MEGLFCTHVAITTDVPLQIWEAITTDGPSGTPLWLTRVLHNKPVFFFLNYARCYFHYLSPKFLGEVLSPLGAIAFLAVLYFIAKRGGKAWNVLYLIIALYPLVFLFELQKMLK
ncbi:MAG: hypothetical protein A2900_03215 [Candidatus Chisholmbacteria bacterium RIFCSPLOWO2_01_FULL_50_28]|uniref:Uncharacterized protein n=1 Tax=Candidatus Chisholmbacteria bacterium RIFCSPHIGHO2_01_FULL_52_32 TaxID=1797591 RepID=A0A1G1VT06_9BACT|nr:MAG: hypothetical protein A2786_03530 [Candidatus Chisholmbacteria bacterium RIFCSPHIGHO2_01_FULL_52_32]OGY20086.1 MAG: hypothetical protein A2900_03215 [Candidatus Chisholmbacteria bacterium RIFCSPLOWO2_01_FULL_50_28]